ncbi:NAD(+) synthase [Roseiflexus sp.]|uniref:NAD(+) synthase n=1 Tax=Roseiflexus sp. TaxID=2562120 RepID=UPI0021DF29D5|nr:NAD(+) synthase [Roseiflexus sp.]GIV99250.1 MAG: NH(3)-dependent NAD(+) synthetase [Roseiflexus sp.]
MGFDARALQINAAAEAERIIAWLQYHVIRTLHRQGVVLGISGGIDSSVALALCVRAFGPQRVAALMMPERDSDPQTLHLSEMVARHYGVEPILEDITPALEGFGCYCRRDEAVRRIFPEYDAAHGYKMRIVLPQNLLDTDTLNVFSLEIITPDGEVKRKRLPPREYAHIVAASNVKQRTRMAMVYYHAELRNYAVIGTPNKNEHDQGFFVKYGDGGADLRPIVHLYKTQIYQLARYLDVPEVIQRRPPTSDTYSAPTTQQEFFFRLPFETMDLLWYAQEHHVPVVDVAEALRLTPVQVQRAFNDFARKRRTTAYLRVPPLELCAEEHAAITMNHETCTNMQE